MSNKKIGIMGGTFDPIHNGHLLAASEVAFRFSLDEVIFVPTGVSWQKQDRNITNSEDRYLMTVIATAPDPRLRVSRIEIDRGCETYTLDTLRELRSEYPDDDLYFITGADALEKIFSWKDSKKLFDLAYFVGVTRPGHSLQDFGLPNVKLVEIPGVGISSSMCRERVCRGEPLWYLVPDGVQRYIDKNKLYTNYTNDARLTMTAHTL